MPHGRGVGEVHRFPQIRAAFRRDFADVFEHFLGLVAGDAVHPQPGGAGESDDADPGPAAELPRQHPQGFAQMATRSARSIEPELSSNSTRFSGPACRPAAAVLMEKRSSRGCARTDMRALQAKPSARPARDPGSR